LTSFPALILSQLLLQAKARRVRESEQLSERVITVTDLDELDAVISKAGDKLMVIEVSSDQHCQIDEEHEIAPASCQGIKTSFQRTARDCPDALFLEVVVENQNSELAESLGVDVLPTVQFVKNGKLLWEHRGVSNLDQDLAEGVLFYGDAGAGGSHPSDFITEITNKADMEKWNASLDDKVLGVLDISMSNAAACVHIYPTVVVLARQFKGFASFARLIGDSSDDAKELMKELNVKSVPTFRFLRSGNKVVGEHVGTSRSDLISAILGKQAELGLTPPPPEEGRRARMQHAADDVKNAPKKVEKRWNSIF
jgi:thioredoxin-like negative regulator of GroEL